MKHLYKIFFLGFLYSLLLFSLSACGRFSQPSPVEGSGYPHTYPQH